MELLIRSWEHSLVAANKAPKTVLTYSGAARAFAAHLATQPDRPALADVRRRHVEAFIADLLARCSASTASVRYRALQQFFKWLIEEEEIDASPMAKMKPPIIREKQVPVLTDPQITRLLATCSGSGYRDRRDLAILRLLLEGPRLAEVTGLAVEDVDLGDRQVWVLGKGRRQRPVPIGAKTAKALDRWIRTRDAQTHWDPWRDRPGALWVGSTGHPMTGSGVSQVVRRRGRQIGIEGLHPHQFRHTFSHLWLAGGGEGSDLMKINGWSSRSMLDRYGSSVATERAQKAHRRLAPGDRF